MNDNINGAAVEVHESIVVDDTNVESMQDFETENFVPSSCMEDVLYILNFS